VSIVGKILDIFGPGGNNKFYARDFRNAYSFRPDQNPPRQKFQGYVSFVVNRELYGDTLYGNEVNSEFRLRLGSLVRTASLPEVEFKTQTKNAYNRKRIINTGVDYQPVNIKVFDTINNEWLILFMKYFTYNYMNPRNKQFGEREVGNDPRQAYSNQGVENSQFGKDGANKWDSNAYGYNLNELANFFERIDYVLYHGNKGVQYSLIKPVLTQFRTGEIDYSDSNVMEFDMTFEYESFAIYEQVNFGLSEFDVARFENARDFTGPAFVEFNKPELLKERTLEMLSGNGSIDQYARTAQPAPPVPPTLPEPSAPPAQDEPLISNNEILEELNFSIGQQVAEQQAELGVGTIEQPDRLPSIYGDKGNFASPVEKEKSFIGGLLGSIADNALSAAINGTSIKNAVLNTAVAGTIQGITDVIQPAVRGARSQPSLDEETASASTAPKPPVTPPGDG
jgi:hypothetical protein